MRVLAQNWWAIGILFGLVALLLPGATMLSLVLLFAAYIFVDGIFAIVSAVRAAQHHERWGFLVLEGIINIVAAGIAVLWPGITVIAFVLVVAFWAIVSGGFMLAAAYRMGPADGRWWLVLGGIASVIYGILLVIAPVIGAVVLTWWLGAYALVFGVSLLILAFRLRSRAGSAQRPAQAAG
jgi:uncharacterized membrane protein HdeD (DUF308 family)